MDALPTALAAIATWQFLAAFLIGCANGMLTGLLPGLGGSVGIALMIPFTYGMETTTAIGLFVAALAGQSFCGSVSAILLNIPGSSPSAATTLDGYPLARMGRGGFAIGISASASFLGALIGTIALIALIPAVRPLVLSFSFAEFTLLGVLGLIIIAMASRGSMVKGIISGLLGVLVSFVGFAPVGGDVRYAFDQPALFNGFEVVVVLVGMFAITEALELLRTNQSVARGMLAERFGYKQIFEGMLFTVKQPFLLARSSLIGTGVGLVPAVGGTVAAFLAYFQAARTVKNPRFGQGDPRGVLAPEASNDAKDAGSALPSLAFGIPGSSDWAIVMGAMVIHGLTPGPNLIRENPDIVWIAILVLIAASFFSSFVGVLAGPQLLHITRVKPGILSPMVLLLAVVGAFALNLSVVDVLVSIGFGLVAYVMRSVGMPLIPLILGFILGPLVERSYLQTVSTYGFVDGFFSRPITLVLIALTIGVICYEVYSMRRAGKRDPIEISRGVVSATRPYALVVMSGFGLVGVAALVMATEFSPQGRTFPMITAAALVALVGAYLLIALVPGLRHKAGGVIADGGGMEELVSHLQHEAVELVETRKDAQAPDGTPTAPDGSGAESAAVLQRHAPSGQESGQVSVAAEETQNPREMARRLRVSLMLVVAMLAVTVMFGVEIAVPLTLLAFLRLVTAESWRTTLLTTVLGSAAFYLVFHTLLGVPLEGGMLLSH
ncbi:tripartite tricarboxylate transporter permease [Mycobacterium sp. NAZ190054]|uniref:tripartite tricarboxylate transporter permease n=1 Tax=Mycobacterium sp. NAZ190054 TaxID=1747766 RepID=UPI001E5F18CD|nr:tripartite tricarboxylate transporter permease [Mycobacterium sp. NAZ190054]